MGTGLPARQCCNKLRASGLHKDAIHAALIPLNASMCEVPVSDEDLEHIADSMMRYEVPEKEPVAILGSKKAEREPVTDALQKVCSYS